MTKGQTLTSQVRSAGAGPGRGAPGWGQGDRGPPPPSPGCCSHPYPLTTGVTGVLREGDQESRLRNLGRPVFSLDRANCLAAGPLAAARAEVALEGGGRYRGSLAPYVL